jgi:hypothetical protein
LGQTQKRNSFVNNFVSSFVSGGVSYPVSCDELLSLNHFFLMTPMFQDYSGLLVLVRVRRVPLERMSQLGSR